jgi:peroxiredoxin
MRNIICIALILVSQNNFGQFMISKNIDQPRFNNIATKAVIRDSTDKVINIKDVYTDIVNGKKLLISKNGIDTTELYVLGVKSKKLGKIFEEYLKESKKLNRQLIGKPCPDIGFTDMDGNKYQLSQLKGKVIVINYWFIGCGPCRRELPELNQLVEKFKGKNVLFFAFANDRFDDLKTFLEKNKYLYQIVPDAHTIAKQNNINSYPTNIVIDAKGTLRFFESGYSNTTAKNIENHIKRLLD